MSELNAAGKMDKEIAATLNEEGFVAARGLRLQGRECLAPADALGRSYRQDQWKERQSRAMARRQLLRSGWADALGVTSQTIFDYLAQGFLEGRQPTKGQPWQIALSDQQIATPRARVSRTRRSKKEAS